MNSVSESVSSAYGYLPENWRLEKLKFFAAVRNSNVDKVVFEEEEPVKLCNYVDVYYNDRITPDLDLIHGSATPVEIKKFQLKSGQVIITKDSESWDDIGIPAIVTEDMPDVVCGYHLSVLEANETDLHGPFLAWLCRALPLNDQFKLASNGVTRFGLGQYPIKNALIGLPSLSTQKRIAAFLDEKTGRIDALIEKKRALLDRLAEKRQALITRAVTKGLNPNAPMKPSGVDWLGDIPAHWEVKPLWTAVKSLESGISVNAMDVPAEGGQKAILKTSAVFSGKFDHLENKTVFDEFEEERLSCPVRGGEIIISRMNTPALVGASGLVERDYSNLFLPDRLWQTRFWKFSSAIAPFLYFFLNSKLFRTIIASLATGTSGSMQNISQDDLLKIKIGMPPITEQKNISGHLVKQLEHIDHFAKIEEKSIQTLTEYRAALITTAVTGQIKGLR